MSRKMRPWRPLDDEFWSMVERRAPSECWPWRGGRRGGAAGKTYGSFHLRLGRDIGAHRMALVLTVGPAPRRGLHAAHSCHNRTCVNPAHLRWATQRENLKDSRGYSALARWFLGQCSYSDAIDFANSMIPDVCAEDIPWPSVIKRRHTGETPMTSNRLHDERVERMVARMATARPYDRCPGRRMGTWSIFGDDPFVPVAVREKHTALPPVDASWGTTWIVRGQLLRWMYLLFRWEPGRYLVNPHPWLMDATRRMMEVSDAA